MANLKKISVTLPAELSDDLTRASKRLGVSRSALLATVLEGALPPVMAITENMPSPDDVASMQRYTREKSLELTKMFNTSMEGIQALTGSDK